ncbi:hypothetical protein BC629DRAFT_1444351 [Irpex lacteus]|nr:hypothetical protein BC629DRAFT_1444351 [Irpex lacteus]
MEAPRLTKYGDGNLTSQLSLIDILSLFCPINYLVCFAQRLKTTVSLLQLVWVSQHLYELSLRWPDLQANHQYIHGYLNLVDLVLTYDPAENVFQLDRPYCRKYFFPTLDKGEVDFEPQVGYAVLNRVVATAEWNSTKILCVAIPATYTTVRYRDFDEAGRPAVIYPNDNCLPILQSQNYPESLALMSLTDRADCHLLRLPQLSATSTHCLECRIA